MATLGFSQEEDLDLKFCLNIIYFSEKLVLTNSWIWDIGNENIQAPKYLLHINTYQINEITKRHQSHPYCKFDFQWKVHLSTLF